MALVAICALTASAQTTTTITGTIKDLTNTAVTSGYVTFTLQPSVDTTISGSARYTPQIITCTITGTGAVKANDGVSACTVTNNTSLSPSGTSYVVAICAYNACSSNFNFYAVGGTTDITTVVPTPTTAPAYTFLDTFSQQTVTGNKTFSGTSIFSGSTVFSGTFSSGNSYTVSTSGLDICANIMALYNAFGAIGGEIRVPGGDYNCATQLNFSTSTVHLLGAAAGYEQNAGHHAAVRLTWTGGAGPMIVISSAASTGTVISGFELNNTSVALTGFIDDFNGNSTRLNDVWIDRPTTPATTFGTRTGHSGTPPNLPRYSGVFVAKAAPDQMRVEAAYQFYCFQCYALGADSSGATSANHSLVLGVVGGSSVVIASFIQSTFSPTDARPRISNYSSIAVNNGWSISFQDSLCEFGSGGPCLDIPSGATTDLVSWTGGNVASTSGANPCDAGSAAPLSSAAFTTEYAQTKLVVAHTQLTENTGCLANPAYLIANNAVTASSGHIVSRDNVLQVSECVPHGPTIGGSQGGNASTEESANSCAGIRNKNFVGQPFTSTSSQSGSAASTSNAFAQLKSGDFGFCWPDTGGGETCTTHGNGTIGLGGSTGGGNGVQLNGPLLLASAPGLASRIGMYLNTNNQLLVGSDSNILNTVIGRGTGSSTVTNTGISAGSGAIILAASTSDIAKMTTGQTWTESGSVCFNNTSYAGAYKVTVATTTSYAIVPTGSEPTGCGANFGTASLASGAAIPLIVQGATQSTATTFANLPVCNAAAAGAFQAITDSNTAVFNAAIAGGGANTVLAFCNGASWVAH
jgi:hypothetical protein